MRAPSIRVASALLSIPVAALASVSVVDGQGAASVADRARGSSAEPPALASSDEALQGRLLELASRCPRFEMLGDPFSSTGRELKAIFSTHDGRESALRAILPVALDPRRDLADRRDAWRLVGSILNRAAGDDELESLIADEEFAEPLRAVVVPVAADATVLIDAAIANAALPADEPGGAGVGPDASISVRAEAHRPLILLPQQLFLLARLQDAGQLEALHRRALDGVATLKQTNGRSIEEELYRGAAFPQGSFLWAFGLLRSDDGAGVRVIVESFNESIRTQDHRTLLAALDAMQHVEEPDPILIDRVRTLIERPPIAVVSNAQPGDLASFDLIEILRVALRRYADLGVKRFQVAGEVGWLDTMLGWITRQANTGEDEQITLTRASYADLALARVTEPQLWPTLMDAIIPRLGSGHPAIRDRSLLRVMSMLPPPTEGDGPARRVTPGYEAAMASALAGASAKFRPEALRAMRACGRWAEGTSIEDQVRSELRTSAVASQVLAHILGAEARVELEALREAGPFEPTIQGEVAEERQRMLDMLAQGPRVMAGSARVVLQEQLVRRDGIVDGTDPRFAKLDRFVERIMAPDALLRRPDESARRSVILAEFRAEIERTVGPGTAVTDSELEALSHHVGNALSFCRQWASQYSFDWNLTRALEIVDLYERLERPQCDDVRAVLAALRQRRRDRVWEIAEFDVYAWVPRIILLYEQAPERFDQDDTTRVRKDILSTLAEFRSTTGRRFLADVIADPSTPTELRDHAASLAPRPLKELGDEAH